LRKAGGNPLRKSAEVVEAFGRQWLWFTPRGSHDAHTTPRSQSADDGERYQALRISPLQNCHVPGADREQQFEILAAVEGN
jgi:hypothetical protein